MSEKQLVNLFISSFIPNHFKTAFILLLFYFTILVEKVVNGRSYFSTLFRQIQMTLFIYNTHN